MSPSVISPPSARAVDPRYAERRGQIEHYFDRTAAQAWARLTSDAPVSGKNEPLSDQPAFGQSR